MWWVDLCGSRCDEVWPDYSLVFVCVVVDLCIQVSCYDGGSGSGLACDVLVQFLPVFIFNLLLVFIVGCICAYDS